MKTATLGSGLQKPLGQSDAAFYYQTFVGSLSTGSIPPHCLL